jgi:hypothetical protein
MGSPPNAYFEIQTDRYRIPMLTIAAGLAHVQLPFRHWPVYTASLHNGREPLSLSRKDVEMR